MNFSTFMIFHIHRIISSDIIKISAWNYSDGLFLKISFQFDFLIGLISLLESFKKWIKPAGRFQQCSYCIFQDLNSEFFIKIGPAFWCNTPRAQILKLTYFKMHLILKNTLNLKKIHWIWRKYIEFEENTWKKKS